MEDIPKLRIKIKDFRAISTADIILNGITVVAGINGSGKSTISKLLYRTVKTAIDFDKIVAEKLSNDLIGYKLFLEELSRELELFYRGGFVVFGGKNEEEKRIRFDRVFSTNNGDLKEYEEKILFSIDSLKKTFDEFPSESKKGDFSKKRFYRLERFFKEEFFEINKGADKIDISQIFDKLKEKIIEKFQVAYNTIENRPLNILDETINYYFNYEENIIASNFNIEELGAVITNREEEKLFNLLSINKVTYIDTPMVVGLDDVSFTNIPHWEELELLLKNKSDNANRKSKVNSILKDEIIEGEANYDPKSENFIYNRNDGFSIDLLSCATGLKSFSILQILFNNGYLDNKTLLILDEPEAHLHPEWIVQYARLVVLLHKEFKINFLISSHNPDMVMAIKYIAKKELDGNNGVVNFYVAKESQKFSYSFENSQDSIESIFSSFNVSLDKINEFGSSED